MAALSGRDCVCQGTGVGPVLHRVTSLTCERLPHREERQATSIQLSVIRGGLGARQRRSVNTFGTDPLRKTPRVPKDRDVLRWLARHHIVEQSDSLALLSHLF